MEWKNPDKFSRISSRAYAINGKVLHLSLKTLRQNARTAEKRAYLSFNKLTIEGKSFLLDDVTGGLKAIRKSDQIFANRYTRLYGNIDLTCGQAHDNVDGESRGHVAGRDDIRVRAHPLAACSQPTISAQ